MRDERAIWTAADVDAHDYGLSCAYAHPDCGAAELSLLSGRYVWRERSATSTHDLFAGAMGELRNLEAGRVPDPVEYGARARSAIACSCWSSAWAPQEAAGTTNDIVTSRLHQFENSALTELPVLYADSGVTAGDQATVVRGTGRPARMSGSGGQADLWARTAPGLPAEARAGSPCQVPEFAATTRHRLRRQR